MLNTYLIYHLINCIVLVIRTLLYIEEEQGKREERGEGCRRHLRQFLAPLCSVCSFTVHTIASRSPPRPHLAINRPATSKQQTTGQRLARLSSCPPRPLPLFQVVRAGQSTSQGGRSPPAHPADPLHPAGVRPNICGHIRRHSGGHPAITGRRGSSSRKFVSGFFARLYRSKYQLFIFSAGLRRAKASAVEVGNCT